MIQYCFSDVFSIIIANQKIYIKSKDHKNVLPITEQESSFIEEHYPYYNSQTFKKEFPKLFRRLRKYLLPVSEQSWFYAYNNTRFEKTALYYFMKGINFDAVKKLQDKTVLIIGCGGVGTEILKHLISGGVGHAIVVDHDRVNITNLNRQYLFSHSDIKKLKVNVAQKKYTNQVTPVKAKILCPDDVKKILDKFPEIDMVINCADIPPIIITKHILEAIYDKQLPFAYCGVGLDYGNFSVILNNKSDKRKLLKNLQDISSVIEWTSTCRASFGPTNSIISDMVAKDIIFCLLEQNKLLVSKGNEFLFDFERMEGVK